MKSAKKITSVILAIVLLLGTLSCVQFSALADTLSGNYSYRVLDDGTAEITRYYSSPEETSISIPSELDGYTVTSIGYEAFYYNSIYDYTDYYCGGKYLTSVTIPKTVKTIGVRAFYNCLSLTSINIPNGVKSIGEYAFSYCSSLTSVSIPNSVESIDRYAFTYCSSLTKVTIPSSVTSIGNGAFSGCSSLTSISIPNSIKSIDSSTFSGCSSLTKVTIPSSVTSIGSEAFYGCSALTSVSISNGVKIIGSKAFSSCKKLSSITIPSSVIDIGYGVFLDCESLTAINVDADNKNYTSVGGVLFSKDKSILQEYPMNKSGKSYSVPNGVERIETYAFACNKLESITLPGSIKDIAQYAFYGCNALESIVLPDGTASIGMYAFYYCDKLKDITVPASAKEIGRAAFLGYNLKNIYYTGTMAQWRKTDFGYYFNIDYLGYIDVTVHYNYVPPLETPKISSVSNTSNGIKITWGKVDGAEKYRVFYKENGESSWHKVTDTASTSYTWTEAKSSTHYTFTVRCLSSDGKSYTSGYDATGKSIGSLATPKLSSVSSTAAGIEISWGKVSGALNYRVFYKANGESTWHNAGETTSTSLTWTKAASGTEYTFTVRCISKDGNTYTSAYDTTGKSISYIAAPKISSLTNTATGVQISWGKVTGAAKYRVFYKANGESSWHKLTDTASTSYTWTKAVSGTKYTFTVRCLSSDGSSYTSAYDTTGKSITYIAAPQISSLTSGSSGITIKWGKVTGAENYRVFYKEQGESSWHKVADTTSTNCTWTGGKAGTTYFFTVRCLNSDGSAYTGGYDSTGKSITK